MYACKFCICIHGLKSSEVDKLPKTQEELFDHLERVHGIPVVREGETEHQAQRRVFGRTP